MKNIIQKIKDYLAIDGCWHVWTNETIPPYSFFEGSETCIRCNLRRVWVSNGWEDTWFEYSKEYQEKEEKELGRFPY